MFDISVEKIKQWRPPAITTGLIPFVIILGLATHHETLQLTPDALFKINLNKLSFYPLVFANIWHFVLGMLLFTPFCGAFEIENGTVRTGVVLNVVAVIPGVLSNVIAKVSGDRLAGAAFCGPTSWIAALAAFLSVSSWTLPVIPVGSHIVSIPPWILPLTGYFVTGAFAPQFLVIHGLSLVMGYGLGLLYLDFLVAGTTTPVEWIETKIEKVIQGLRYIVHFVTEVEARDLRRNSLVARRRSMEADAGIPMPAAS